MIHVGARSSFIFVSSLLTFASGACARGKGGGDHCGFCPPLLLLTVH
jgi:hypothetical protein